MPVLKLPPGGVAACSRKKEHESRPGEVTDVFSDWVDDDDEPAFWEISENKTRVRREIEEQPGVFSSLYSK